MIGQINSQPGFELTDLLNGSPWLHHWATPVGLKRPTRRSEGNEQVIDIHSLHNYNVNCRSKLATVTVARTPASKFVVTICNHGYI